MRFELTSDQKLLQSSTADYLDAHSSTGAVRAIAAGDRSLPTQFWSRGAELGWTTLLVPEALGGGSVSGEGLIDATVIAEELGRRVAPGPFGVTNTVAAALSEAANAASFTDTLESLMAGQIIATWACYTPDTGWDPAAVQVTAEPTAGGFRLNGTHDRVQEGGTADVFLVLARTPEGLTQFLVPRGADGLTVTAERTVDLLRNFATVTYENVPVPTDSVVGVEGAADAVERQFQIMVVLQCAELVGTMQRALAITRQWMFDRYSFGRPLASYQALKHRYADMTLWCEASEATMAGAAQAVQDRTPDAGRLVSVAKAWIGQRATDLIQECVQFHGGIGVTWEHDMHLYLRRATVDRVTWGTPSEHRRRIADLLDI